VQAKYETPEWHPAFEEYCEAIYELSEDQVDVIQARIAERLRVTRPAVSEMVRRMEGEGLVAVAGGAVNLTSRGSHLAEQVVRRHRLAERFLTDVLGLPSSGAHREAGKWEHVISDEVEAALVRVLGDPTTCPHGNPIPGTRYKAAPTKALSALPVGARFTVARIPEELEFTPGLLEFLEKASIAPGAKGEVTALSPDGTITVEMGGERVGVGAFAADRILATEGVNGA